MEDAKGSPLLPLSSITITSKTSVYPSKPSTIGRLNLSIFDVRLLFFHYAQFGLLFHRPIHPSSDLLNLLRSSLSRALSIYPPLAGRLSTDADGSYFIACNDAGVDFVHAMAPRLSIANVVEGNGSDIPDVTKELFLLHGVINLEGCSIPLAGRWSLWIVRVFHFSREAIQDLKARAISLSGIEGSEISSFKSLCAQLWRSVTRARRLSSGMATSLGLAANCRNRLEPPLGTHYFGNAAMTIVTVAKAEEVVEREVGWCAQLLHRNVVALGDESVRREMESWKERKDPKTLESSITGPFLAVASSPRFPIHDIDMGWGPPVAVFSGSADKCDGLMLAFRGREGGGSVDLEVCLAPETMARLESDSEFMQYVAGVSSLAIKGKDG